MLALASGIKVEPLRIEQTRWERGLNRIRRIQFGVSGEYTNKVGFGDVFAC